MTELVRDLTRSEVATVEYGRILSPDNFLYVFKPGPSGARKRAATGGRAAGGSSPWGLLPGGPWLGAHVPKGAARRQRDSSSTNDTLEAKPNGRHP
jgi:hypothetical protein